MKFLIFNIGLILAIVSYASSTIINCKYYTSDDYYLKAAYHCEAGDDLKIYSLQSAVISSASGTHESGKSNNDVVIFYSVSSNVEYFPKGLEKVFQNLKGLQIRNSRIARFSPLDFKPFPNIVQLFLYINNFEVLEDGLLDSNTQLASLSFWGNSIFHIGSKFFAPLTKLVDLHMGSNPCIDRNVRDSASGVQEMITAMKSSCNNQDYLDISKKLKEIEADIKLLNCAKTTSIKTSLALLETKFLGSSISSYSVMRQQFEALKQQLSDVNYVGHCALQKSISNANTQTGKKIDALDKKLSKSISDVNSLVKTVANTTKQTYDLSVLTWQKVKQIKV